MGIMGFIEIYIWILGEELIIDKLYMKKKLYEVDGL